MGQAVSNLGISISSFAYPLIVLEATGSAAKAGVVGSILAGTAFFLRLPAGALADRWSRRTILVVCDGGRALNAGALALVVALGHVLYAQVLAVAVVEATLGVLFGPAETAAVRRVVPAALRREAVAQNQTRSALPGLVGPPLGGVLYTASRALPFVADAISYLVSLVCIVSVRTQLGGGRAEASPRLRESLTAGLRFIWRRRFLRALLLWSVGIGLVYNSLGLALLVLARDRGASPSALGAMFAITAAGGAAGAFAAPWILRRFEYRTVLLGFAWVGVLAAAALVPTRPSWAIGLLGAGAFFLAPAAGAIAFAVIAEEADDAIQGRVTSAAIQLATIGAPLGPVAAGVLLGAIGAHDAIVVYAGALAALAVVATVSPGLRAAPFATA